ncbi:hypothetical protein [Chloroflexus sp.]|nr:hypothetical protein [Chloroflexus sp.]
MANDDDPVTMSRITAHIQVLFIFMVYCQWRGGVTAQDGLRNEAG